MTEDALIEQLGDPLRTVTEQGPTGARKVLYFSDEPGQQTFFSISDRDGTVSGGKYKGRPTSGSRRTR
jgi:hypothetical protein